MNNYRCERDGVLVSTERTLLNLDAVHGFLSRSYWAEGIPRETVARSLEHSLCFGLYHDGQQIGLARVISDFTTYAYLCDVYVLQWYRGKGLAAWLVDWVLRHPDLQGLRRFNLVTRDAHGLYRKFGFSEPARPGGYMELLRSDIYRQKTGMHAE